MYVVTGATGNTGKVVAQTLLERGQKVRVVVRDAAKAESLKSQGAEVVVADLGNTQALTQALKGAQGAYLLLPPPPPSATGILESRRHMADALAQAARESGVPRIVALSSVGAQHPEGTGVVRALYYLEQVLGKLPASVTFIRAAYFLENWASYVPPAAMQGHLPNFLVPIERKIPMVATRDIGTVSAQELLQPSGKRVVELAGPEDYSPQDVGQIIQKLVGRPVHVAAYPIGAMAMGLLNFGFSAELGGLMQELTEGVIRGHVVPEDLAHQVRGTTTLEQFLTPLVQPFKRP
jgi:uncharacterized protein YbjT (DUF2867 family)